MGRWQRWVDPRVAVDNRWHSSHVGLVRSPTLLGDHLVSQLRELAGATDDDMALARTGQFLHKKLRLFEKENRLLLRLADSARVILLLQRTIESVLGMSDLLESEIREIWDRNLESERLEWIREIENVLKDEERMKLEMGGCHQQLQVLTLLKHQLAQYREVLTSRELDVVSDVFEWVTRRGNVVVGKLPHWLAASELEWFRAKRTTVEEGEESCERQATLWAKLHHPNVRKFFGACHVGKPFVIHEASSELPLQMQKVPRRGRNRRTRSERAAIKKFGRSGAHALGKVTQTWRRLLGCALGLQYVHDLGLVHQRLTAGHLLYSQASQKGVLSGMGLMRRRGMNSSEFDEGPSVPSDILALGRAIFDITVKNRSPDMDINFEGLPDVRPDFIRKTEWDLLLGMCAPDPAKRTCMADVVHQLSALARRTPPTVPKCLADAPATVEDVSRYKIQSLGMTLPATLEEIHQICEEVDNDSFRSVNRPVYERLEDVYQQLGARSKPVPTALVESFSLVVLRFLDVLDQRALGGKCVVASICASATIAGKNYSFHHDIDTLLRLYDLQTSSSVHRWQKAWRESRQQQVNALNSYLEKSETVLDQIPNAVDQSEALVLMQFAAKNQFGDSQQDGIDDFNDLPLWFIPPYQVQLGKHIADGSFGAVYEGEWLDTEVVVKQVLLDPSDKENWEQFRREADLWFTLNHPNLIKLYGACHQGRPFFVCEPASHGTLATYLKGKTRRTIWFAIGDAALGLQHLHDHGIIHGDIKGNNILVCDSTDGYPTAKLADFGLSIVTTRSAAPSSDESGGLGAFRWKAPECLLGARPTFASDIFSFGMCILEAITGQYPWGNALPDAVVARNVVEMQQLPARPECINDDEWQLVTRMCRYEPRHRIPIGAVINCAFNLAG